ncbi:Transcriptional regulator with GAF, ATPase, and Fis domain OS=Streptomyces griseomycini OX=66895 GN=FHS37_006552 PE=4 SV=1 [Streptomyces griseomycini]
MRQQLPQLESVYALPVFFGDYVLGTIDLLALRSHALGDETLNQASQVAEAVAAALMTTRDMLLTGTQAPAWEPEKVVRAHWFDTTRAIGTLVARQGVTAEDALALMRAEAFRTGRSPSDIASAVLRDPPDAP